MSGFLPITKKEAAALGWDAPDFVYVIGDAYVDHSSFGPAVISRVLEAHGYKVAIIPQPDFHDENSICEFGEPRLGFLVSSGNMDSMVNHYTVNKKPRSEDAYSPGGKPGKRPDYALTVYCNMIKRKYKNKPVIAGGIEASLRRLAHYDYWSDRLRRSVLLDSGADLLLWGMGELSVVELADALAGGLDISDITYIAGSVYKTRDPSGIEGAIMLPSYDEMKAAPEKYAESFAIQYRNTDFAVGKPLVECYGEHRYVVQNPASRPLTQQELDAVYELPYMNTYHPSYEKAGGVPAIREIKFSLTSCRGCFGGCSFCSLTFHQGRIVQSRSHESLVREAEKMTKDPEFKGYIHDVGGPTANFRRPACDKQTEKGACPGRQCLWPKPCPNLVADHSDYIELLHKLRDIPGVKKVFIRSGIRFDYLLADSKNGQRFLDELCRHHISGQLRTAPEHVSNRVLDLMGKPRNEVYEEFVRRYEKTNSRTGSKQYCVPYLISSHPGSTLNDAVALAEAVRNMGYMPEQVQDFYPTPSTVSTVMYYTGLDPRTMKEVYVPRDMHEKHMQRALIQYKLPENHALVCEALRLCGREDLIGTGPRCLVGESIPGKRNLKLQGIKADGNADSGRTKAVPFAGNAGGRTGTVPSAGKNSADGLARLASSAGKNSADARTKTGPSVVKNSFRGRKKPYAGHKK